MDLKLLFNEVETARTGIHIRHTERMVRDLDHYEKELMPELADRLKKAVDALKHYQRYLEYASSGMYRDVNNEKVLANLRLWMKQIEGPNPNHPVVENATHTCPIQMCGELMKRAEKSKGWYCPRDHIFIPDECV